LLCLTDIFLYIYICFICRGNPNKYASCTRFLAPNVVNQFSKLLNLFVISGVKNHLRNSGNNAVSKHLQVRGRQYKCFVVVKSFVVELIVRLKCSLTRPTFSVNYVEPFCWRESFVALKFDFIKNSQLSWAVRSRYSSCWMFIYSTSLTNQHGRRVSLIWLQIK